MSGFDIYDYEGGLPGYYAQHLESMYEQAMDYLNQTYMNQPFSLPEIPLSEYELGELSYYEAMAADTAEEVYTDLTAYGWLGEYSTYDLPPPQARPDRRIPWGRLVF